MDIYFFMLGFMIYSFIRYILVIVNNLL